MRAFERWLLTGSGRADGLGRFQVVATNGPTSIAVTGLLIGGSASLAIGLGWFFYRYRRQPT